MLVYGFYELLLFIGDNILLVGLKLGYQVLDLLVVDAKYSGCRAGGDSILDDAPEL